MQRKIFKTGNSVVISLPREALDALGLQAGGEVNLEIDRQSRQLLVTPAETPLAAAGVDEDFARQVSEFIEQYRPALEKLARE